LSPVEKDLSRAVPYGVYDIANNAGWVSVGTDHDTASFAVNAIRRWWRTKGRKSHPNGSGLPLGRHSRPLFLKLSTNSFFFVSTEMIGSCAARNATACVLMY
jgi:DDE family transposase